MRKVSLEVIEDVTKASYVTRYYNVEEKKCILCLCQHYVVL